MTHNDPESKAAGGKWDGEKKVWTAAGKGGELIQKTNKKLNNLDGRDISWEIVIDDVENSRAPTEENSLEQW